MGALFVLFLFAVGGSHTIFAEPSHRYTVCGVAYPCDQGADWCYDVYGPDGRAIRTRDNHRGELAAEGAKKNDPFCEPFLGFDRKLICDIVKRVDRVFCYDILDDQMQRVDQMCGVNAEFESILTTRRSKDPRCSGRVRGGHPFPPPAPTPLPPRPPSVFDPATETLSETVFCSIERLTEKHGRGLILESGPFEAEGVDAVAGAAAVCNKCFEENTKCFGFPSCYKKKYITGPEYSYTSRMYLRKTHTSRVAVSLPASPRECEALYRSRHWNRTKQ